MKKFLIAFCLSLFWVFFATDYYLYENVQFIFLGLNLYPLVAWTIGLFLSVYMFEKFFKKDRSFIKNFVFYFLFYLFCLIFLETLFYHVFGIVNLSALNYPGLPICNCLHAVWWMKIMYFLIGPAYFLLLTFCNKYNKKSLVSL